MNSILRGFESPTWNLARTACETDDTSLIAEALSSTLAGDDLEAVYQYSIRHAITNNATNVLTHVIEHGANVQTLLPNVVAGDGHTSKAVLEVLVALGWNINWRHVKHLAPDCEPFM